MIHAICDFCGKDCNRNAILVTMTPFQNFARYHTDNKPYGNVDKNKSFVMCSECREEHNMPNPYETYDKIDKQELKYKIHINNYTKEEGKE